MRCTGCDSIQLSKTLQLLLRGLFSAQLQSSWHSGPGHDGAAFQHRFSTPPCPPSLSLPFPGLVPPAALGEVRGLCVAPCLEEQVSDDRPSACLTVHDSHGQCGALKLFFRTGSDLVKLDTRYKKYPQQGILSCSLERIALPYSNLEYHPVHFCQGC